MTVSIESVAHLDMQLACTVSVADNKIDLGGDDCGEPAPYRIIQDGDALCGLAACVMHARQVELEIRTGAFN